MSRLDVVFEIWHLLSLILTVVKCLQLVLFIVCEAWYFECWQIISTRRRNVTLFGCCELFCSQCLSLLFAEFVLVWMTMLFTDTHFVPIQLFCILRGRNFASVACSGDIIPHGELPSSFRCIFGLFVGVPIDNGFMRNVLKCISDYLVAIYSIFDNF